MVSPLSLASAARLRSSLYAPSAQQAATHPPGRTAAAGRSMHPPQTLRVRLPWLKAMRRGR